MFKGNDLEKPANFTIAIRYAVVNACYNSSASRPDVVAAPLLICLGYPDDWSVFPVNYVDFKQLTLIIVKINE